MKRRQTVMLILTLFIILAAAQPILAFPGMTGENGEQPSGEQSAGEQPSGEQPAAENSNDAATTGGISLEAHHFFVSPNDQGIEVSETYVFNNTGEAISGGDNLSLAVPEGVTEVIPYRGLEEEGSYRFEDGKIVVTKDIVAGQNIFAFGYKVIKPEAAEISLKEDVDFPTGYVSIILPPHGMEVTGEQFMDDGLQQFDQSTQYRVFSRANIKPGEELVVNMAFSGSGPEGEQAQGAGTGGNVREDNPEFHSAGHIRFWRQSPFAGMNAHLFLLLAVVIPVGMIGFALYRRRKYAAETIVPTDGEEEMFQKLLKKQHSLMDKLKELEQQRADGQVEEEAYQELRDAYKKKLINIKAKIKQLTD